MKKPVRAFKLSTLISSVLVVGFIGFSLGFNYPRIENYIQTSFLDKDIKDLPADLNYHEVEQLYDLLKENYAGNLDAEALLEGAKKGLVEGAGDPYTLYLSAEDAEAFNQDIDGTFSGIGAEIAVKNDRLVILSPLKGSPAAKAGLRTGDHILTIDGQNTTDMPLDEAVGKIRGKAGTKVSLRVASGNDAARAVKITRAVIELPAITSKLRPGHIGYIQVASFNQGATQELIREVTSLKRRGASKFIIDLRDNPGGLLDEAVKMADEALEVGKTIVEERQDSTVLETFRATSGGVLLGAPLIVLINQGSASASEIVAGALAENQAATTLGETTFGKGSVQELIEAGNQTFLKVTVARWYTPRGENISESGIKPQVRVRGGRTSRDSQLNRAIEIISSR